MIYERDLVKEQIRHGGGLTDEEFFAAEILAWLAAPKRAEMYTGKAYYEGRQAILRKKRTAIGRDGTLEELSNLPNDRLVDNRFALLLDQKKNYLLGKPLTLSGAEPSLTALLDGKFMRTLKGAGEEALLCGIAWLFPYIGAGGILRFRLLPGEEVCPFWADAAHEELDCAARVYSCEVYEGRQKRQRTMVELYELQGMRLFELRGGRLLPQGPAQPYITGDGAYRWDKLPLIPIKANAREIPLIRRVKGLQDALNVLLSSFVNCMQENVHNTILVLKNYDGTDLGEFRKNLASYGAVKVRTLEGASGDVDTLRIEVNAENYRLICELLRKAIVQNARGYDGKDDRLGGSPNQMTIQSLYADMDLDASDMETELQAAFTDILWFAEKYLLFTGHKALGKIQVIFNRDMLINESEAIGNCVKSEGILSQETIIAQHPWTKDLREELARVEADHSAAMEKIK